MSGPKDFTIELTAIRAEAIRQRNLAIMQERAAANRQRLQKAREASSRKIENLQRLGGISKATSLRQAETPSQREKGPSTEAPPSQEYNPLSREAQASEEAAIQAATRDLESLASWETVIGQDDLVEQYRPQELADWRRRASKLLSNERRQGSLEQVSGEAKELCAVAEGMSLEAAEIDAKCQTRNDLLRDIIDSLKDVGFFVADPYFENASQPESDVLIQARRACEEVVARVNLTDEVKSVWNGIEGEHCKTAFHDYVESMASRGANVTPKRADLRNRPISIRRGAKDIPRDKEQERGSHQ